MSDVITLMAVLHKLYTLAQHTHLFPIAISWHQGTFLTALVNQIKPTHLIEIGCGYGISTLWIQASSHIPKQHTVVDPNAEPLPIIKKHLAKKCSFITTSSQQYLAKLEQQKNPGIDCFFMDGDERFDGCLTDCYFANRILPVGGHIIIRNIWNPAVRRACQFMIKNLPYELPLASSWQQWLIAHIPTPLLGTLLYYVTTQKMAGLLVLRKTAPDTRPWNHFSRFC